MPGSLWLPMKELKRRLVSFFTCFHAPYSHVVAQFPVSSSLLAYVGVHTIAAGSAGAIATVLTHPFDVVKTKVQVRREDRYHGFLRTMGTIWKVR